MSKLFIEDTTLTAIGDAIREKTGTVGLMSPLDMPGIITSIEGGGSGDGEVFNEWTSTNNYINAYDSSPFMNSQFKEWIDGKPFTLNMASLCGLFYKSSELEDLSKMVINFNPTSSNPYLENMFNGCLKLKNLPKINTENNSGKIALRLDNLFYGCNNLREIDNDFWQQIIKYIPEGSSQQYRMGSWFSNCYSLRELPDLSFLQTITNTNTSNNRHLYYSMFNSCYTLDKIENLPVMEVSATSNMFQGFAKYCGRLSHFTFATDNGTPYVRAWKNQTIDLTEQIGCVSIGMMTDYNSGLTKDMWVQTDEQYQAMKDDYITNKFEYSRYNHTSAVETINSLPDVSSGSGNTIKFKGASGSATDGGAISNLTEEEIAVATAKGWTVEIV